jgi:hypothetical protein
MERDEPRQVAGHAGGAAYHSLGRYVLHRRAIHDQPQRQVLGDRRPHPASPAKDQFCRSFCSFLPAPLTHTATHASGRATIVRTLDGATLKICMDG